MADTVKEHVKKIQDDCCHILEEAKEEAMGLAKERWYEKECEEWDERVAELRAEREEQGGDSDSELDLSELGTHPDEHEEPPSIFEDLEYPFRFDDDHHYDIEHQLESQKDEDRIRSSLLSASSLFEQEINGIKKMTSYADILRRRALRPLPGLSLSSGESVAWCNEKITSSGEILETAALLIENLKLPIETRMVHMVAYGEAFCCRRCYRGRFTKGVSWLDLVSVRANQYHPCTYLRAFKKVSHFVYHREQFEKLRKKKLCVFI